MPKNLFIYQAAWLDDDDDDDDDDDGIRERERKSERESVWRGGEKIKQCLAKVVMPLNSNQPTNQPTNHRCKWIKYLLSRIYFFKK